MTCIGGGVCSGVLSSDASPSCLLLTILRRFDARKTGSLGPVVSPDISQYSRLE